MRIGVFDSGIGGEAIAATLAVAFPDAELRVVNDKEHLPYGSREQDDIIALTDTAIQPLLASACDVIVIACNSASMAGIETLRARYPLQKFIGIEPMIKSAAEMTKTGNIAVCATPATLGSSRYKQSKLNVQSDLTFIEPDCSTWAQLIEENELTRASIDKTITACIDAGADVIVLGCTHYHWMKEEIEDVAHGRAVVIEPSDAIARRVRTLLKL